MAASLAVLVKLHPAGLKAPAWVAYLAVAVLALAGALALSRAHGRHVIVDGFACVVLGGMLLTGLWGAFGPGPRQCVSRISSSSAMAWHVSENACRSAFGLGAFLVARMLVIAVRGWLHRRSVG